MQVNFFLRAGVRNGGMGLRLTTPAVAIPQKWHLRKNGLDYLLCFFKKRARRLKSTPARDVGKYIWRLVQQRHRLDFDHRISG